jgi:hypothetical protein
MKTIQYSIFLSLFILGLMSCDGEVNTRNEGSSLIDAIEGEENVNFSETETFYVLATGGLRLRASADLTSEKKEVLSYGSKVEVAPLNALPIDAVSGLQGKMVKTMQGNKEGFAFDGYLSSIPVPKERQTAAQYAMWLKNKKLAANFEQIESADGMEAEDVFSIPARNFQEAFLIGKKLDIFATDFDLLENSNQSKLAVRKGRNTIQITAQKDSDVQEITGKSGQIKGFDVPSKADDNYWMRYITFEFDNDQIKELSVQVAYEGGSWTCTLAKEGENYVFIKASVAD